VAHLDQTRVMPDSMTRVFSWYDNEWGFSKRMLDTASLLSV
jgi:glyceraldehyde 3-phosphate dehydrogenase